MSYNAVNFCCEASSTGMPLVSIVPKNVSCAVGGTS